VTARSGVLFVTYNSPYPWGGGRRRGRRLRGDLRSAPHPPATPYDAASRALPTLNAGGWRNRRFPPFAFPGDRVVVLVRAFRHLALSRAATGALPP